MVSGVYLIKVRGHQYIGSSSDINRRFREHVYCFSKAPAHFKSTIFSCKLKYPVLESELELEVLEETKDFLEKEIIWISKLEPDLNTEGLDAIKLANAIKWLLLNPTNTLQTVADRFNIRVKLLYHAKARPIHYLTNLLSSEEYLLFSSGKYKEFQVVDSKGVVYSGESFSDMERKYGISRKTFAKYKRI